MNEKKSLCIGNVPLKSNVILAPMAGYTDFAFRKMCLSYGAGLVCTEMVSAKALLYGNKKTIDLLYNMKDSHPSAVQIFGHEPEVMAQVVASPLLKDFDIIDINMGCPAPKITKNGDGSALLNNLPLAKQIIEACVKATLKPVTVKFRIGYYSGQDISVEFAKLCESAGAAAITVHGRTTSQGYSGKVNYAAIAAVKKAVNIPVFVSGDCKSAEDFKNILSITNADGVMVGRAALGHPEIFAEITNNKLGAVDKLKQIEFHYKELLKVYDERFVVLNMRASLAHYLKGKYKNSNALVKLIRCETFSEIQAILNEIFA